MKYKTIKQIMLVISIILFILVAISMNYDPTEINTLCEEYAAIDIVEMKTVGVYKFININNEWILESTIKESCIGD